MTLLQWAEALAALSVVIAFAGAIIGWIFKKYADSLVNRIVKDYLSELKPNGGGSLRDEVKTLGKDVTTLRVEVSHLQGRFAQHLVNSDASDNVW